MISKIKENISRDLPNLPGWRTNRKLVVIESDDWGSIRMPSNEVFSHLESQGINLSDDEGARFNKYDTLATSVDLEVLFETLSGIKDATDRNVVFTPVAVVANPDFDQIKESEFSEYYFEPYTETLARTAGCEKSFGFWKEGMAKRLFVPQFHGREHLNVNPWLRALRANHRNTMIAFGTNMWGISTANDPEIQLEFQAAFDFIDINDLVYQEDVLRSGLGLFRELMGYNATFFVPPNGPFSSHLEQTCIENGIRFLSTPKIHIEPIGDGITKKRYRWLGKKSKSGLVYMTRNCFFEPSDPGKDWIDSCLKEISSAFNWRKPAIISSHRVNYIGALDPDNRMNGLKKLKELLASIMKKWPEAEFITSAELGELISNDK